MQLATKITDSRVTAVYVFVDSQAAIQKLDQTRNNHITKRARQFASQLADLGVEVVIQWCPSHTGIYGNEHADMLAKKGLEAPKSKEAFTSISYIRRYMKELDMKNWQSNWANSKTSKELIYQSVGQDSLVFSQRPAVLEVPRKHQGAYIQLKTGIGYFKSYLFKIGRAEDNRCFGECVARQTPRHLLLECKSYKEERWKMRKRLKAPLTLQQLLNTKRGKKALAGYLMETGIATAEWYENAGRMTD